MALIKTPEDNFINELSLYLDLELDDYSVERIKGYLEKYKETFPVKEATPIVIIKERIVFRELKATGFEKVKNRNEVILITPVEIINIVSQTMGISINRMIGKCREMDCVEARHIAMYLIKEICEEQWTVIGKYFNRDHSSAIHAVSEVRKKISINFAPYVKAIETINQSISRIGAQKRMFKEIKEAV